MPSSGSSRQWAKVNRRRWARVRRAALDRDSWRCQAEGCGRAGLLEVHHVTPLEHGGAPFALSNTTTLCRSDHIRVHGGVPKTPDPGYAALVAELMI